jgi:putative ABC transport system substrate-binding protein
MRLARFACLATLALSWVAVVLSADAQSGAKKWRIGYLTTPADIPREPLVEALREFGYVEGRTMTLEIHSAANDLARLPQLADTMVQTKVDVIVAVSLPAIRAASQATRVTPIVMAFWGGEGLLESGIVSSFARPGTNVTGLCMLAAELDAKRLLLAYGPVYAELSRRVAVYVDRILKGAKPADLRIEQKALGLTIRSAVLARVDEVIQ